MPQPFLQRFPMRPGESLPSFLIRLQSANAYRTTNVISRICQAQGGEHDFISRPNRAETFNTLSQLTCLNPEDLFAASVHRFAPTFTPPTVEPEQIALSGNSVALLKKDVRRHQVWEENEAQYCPLCLAGSAYHRVSWIPVLATVCLKHQCLLIRGCPKCRKQNRLSVRDIVNRSCGRCHFDLTQAPIISAARDEWGLFAQAVTQSWLMMEKTTAGNHQYDLLTEQPLPIRINFLHGLVQTIGQMKHWREQHVPPFSVPTPLPSNKAQREPAHNYTLLAVAFRGVVNWPQGFYRVLDIIRSDKKQLSRGHVQTDFGSLYTVWLERSWRHSSFNFVQDAFSNYLRQHYTLSPSMIHLRRFRDDPAFKEQIPYITEAEAAQLLHTTSKMIRRMVQRGFLGTDKVEEGKYSTRFHLVSRPDVVLLQKKWQNAISLEEVAKLLGVSVELAEDLLEIGLLSAVRGPDVDGTYARAISRQSVAEFLELIESKVVAYYDTISSPVSLTKTAQMLSPHGYNAASVLKLVLEGEIRAYWGWDKDKKLSELRISARQIEEKLADIRQNRPFLTRQEIAVRMGVKAHTVGRWVETGILKQERRLGVGWYFDRAEAEQFIQEHIFTDEASRILGFDEMVVLAWVRKGRLRPVSGRSIDGCHRFLFRRADVERFRPENRLTAPQLAKRIGISRSQLFQWIKQGKVKPIAGPNIDNSGQYLFLASELPT